MDIEQIQHAVYVVRAQNVMIDSDLAQLYGVETKVLNLAVKRNSNRFPEDFMFELTEKEWMNLRFQIETSSLSMTLLHTEVAVIYRRCSPSKELQC